MQVSFTSRQVSHRRILAIIDSMTGAFNVTKITITNKSVEIDGINAEALN